jgi:hypothetical protein
MTAARHFRILSLGALTAVWLGVGGEALSRFEDSWRFDRLTLTQRPPDSVKTGDAERALLVHITSQAGVDPEWFFLPPARLEMPRNRELQRRHQANPKQLDTENFIWNSAALADPDQRLLEIVRDLNVDSLFVFPSYDGSKAPLYRLYPGNDFSPTPWVTNRWGWMGSDAPVRKPPQVIRIGIIGDSTVQNLIDSALQTYLDAWAKYRGYDVRFEVFSAGRLGIRDADAIATLRYELGPMGLDFVYQAFEPSFSWQQNASQMKLFAQPFDAGEGQTDARRVRAPLQRVLAPMVGISALARRTNDLIAQNGSMGAVLREPRKPKITLRLPPGTDGEIVLGEARKDAYFANLIDNLDAYKEAADHTHTTPLVSLERVCAWEGMVLRRGANDRLYQMLNSPMFWPFSYAHVRKILDAHNGVVAAWAKANGVNVVDIDGRMPVDPNLCNDPWHGTEFAHQMRAWLVFQALLPQMEQDLGRGLLPRANGIDSDVHPYLDKPIERVDRRQWLSKFDTGAGARSAATH